jgi:hypothetical protein
LFLLSSPHNASNPVRWGAPVVAGFGLLLILLITLTQQQSFFGRWFLSQALAPERILPSVALGFACGLVSLRMFFTALVLLLIGFLVGFAAYDRVIFLLYIAWNPPSDFSVAGPISCIVAGLTLLSGARLRAWLLPVAAFMAGAMLAIDVFMNDPSQVDPVFNPVLTWSPLPVASLTIIFVSLTVRAFRHNWLVTFGRILGSWTVAIGVLYGGASAPAVLTPIFSSSAIPRDSARGAEFSRSIESGNVVDGKTGRNRPWRTVWQRKPLQP